jgi:hypothetical protein
LALSAQKTIVGMSGTLMRYHGDPIWMERDTTLQQSITRGDTVEQIMSMNGAVLTRTRYLVRGDSAWILRNAGPAGLPPTLGRPVSVEMVGMLNRMLEAEARSADALAQMEALGTVGASWSPEALPETPKSYTVSPTLHITQHRDTVTYIRGCVDAHPDTTLFLLFAKDSVKRLSKPERMFGQGMVVSLTSHMRLALMQTMAATIQRPPPADLPKGPGSCSK